jgi:hypothetical protein
MAMFHSYFILPEGIVPFKSPYFIGVLTHCHQYQMVTENIYAWFMISSGFVLVDIPEGKIM